MQAVDVGGRRMSYERLGHGPPVVLVHGYVADGPSTWRAQLDGLAGDFDVIACDLPGAGGSDDPPETFGMRGFAAALAGFIRVLELGSPHIVGVSFGGAVVIELCREHQALAATITLVSAYAGWAGSLPADEVDRRLNQALDLSRLAPEALVEALLPTMFGAAVPPHLVAAFADGLASYHPAGLRAMARACAEDLTDVVPTINLPTLLIYGDKDTRAPSGVATELHAAIAGSQLEVLSGVGHVCNVEAADPFNVTLRRFLELHAPH